MVRMRIPVAFGPFWWVWCPLGSPRWAWHLLNGIFLFELGKLALVILLHGVCLVCYAIHGLIENAHVMFHHHGRCPDFKGLHMVQEVVHSVGSVITDLCAVLMDSLHQVYCAFCMMGSMMVLRSVGVSLEYGSW